MPVVVLLHHPLMCQTKDFAVFTLSFKMHIRDRAHGFSVSYLVPLYIAV